MCHQYALASLPHTFGPISKTADNSRHLLYSWRIWLHLNFLLYIEDNVTLETYLLGNHACHLSSCTQGSIHKAQSWSQNTQTTVMDVASNKHYIPLKYDSVYAHFSALTCKRFEHQYFWLWVCFFAEWSFSLEPMYSVFPDVNHYLFHYPDGPYDPTTQAKTQMERVPQGLSYHFQW